MSSIDLEDVQGLIVRGYPSMRRARFLLLRIDEPAAFRVLLGDLATEDVLSGPFVTVAADWIDKPPVAGEPPTRCVNIGLTFAGLQALGLPADSLQSFPPEFRAGAAARASAQARLGDPPDDWDAPFDATDELHVVLMAFAVDDAELRLLYGELLERIGRGGAVVLATREAATLSDDPEQRGLVHFGYRDGLSQPTVDGFPRSGLSDPLEPVAPGQFLLGHPKSARGGMHPVPQPAALGMNGSFAAFGVIEQDVAAFEAFLDERSGGTEAGRELLAARLCGRWRNGMPLVLSPDGDDPPPPPTEWSMFDYAETGAGPRCPLGAHVRRANPRRALVPGDASLHRLIRRGMPYGPPFVPGAADGVHRGLVGLFVCASIEHQYEFVLTEWINAPRFADLDGERDPIAGRADPATDQFSTVAGEAPLTGIASFVRNRGTAYCFLPSMTALRHLAQLDPQPAATLGVLFVHGMGTHPQGSTLRGFGDPMIGWLAEGTGTISAVRLDRTQLAAACDAPAHAEVTLLGPGDATLRRWVLAESCWSDSFQAPTYRKIVGWLVAAVPWMIGDYVRGAFVRERARQGAGRLLRVLRGPLIVAYALAGALLSGLLAIALVLLLVVRAIPLKPLRDALDRVPRMLEARFGDIHVILTTHVDRAAIRARIAADHAWLAQRCEATVVVAHSAGAALTHQLIRDGRISAIKAYVTLGEAIWRMRWMVRLSRAGAERLIAVGSGMAGAALIVAALLELRVVDVVAPPAAWVALGLGLGLQAASALLVWRRAQSTQDRHDAVTVLAGKVPVWRDYVASSDPVPAGALYERPPAAPDGSRPPGAPGTAHYQAITVRNRRSIVNDHTSYEANLEGFVAPLAIHLAQVDGLILPDADLPLRPRGARARALRTLSRATSRLASVAVAVAVLVALGGDGLRAVAGHADPLGASLATAVGLDDPIAGRPLGAVVALIAFAAAWLLAGIAARGWDGVDRRRYLAREQPARGPGPAIAVALWWTACIAAAGGLVLHLSDQALRGWWWLPVVLTGCGCLALAGVSVVASARDRVYG